MKKLKRTAYEDATDPYILGEPMGTIGTCIFLAVMFVAPIVAVVYFHYHH